MPTAFDTLEYIHKLKDSGVPDEQAEIHAKAIQEVLESNLATKQDVAEIRRDITEITRDMKEMESKLIRDMKEMETNLRRDTKELECKLEAKIAETKVDIIKWNVAAVFSALGLFTAIIKLLG